MLPVTDVPVTRTSESERAPEATALMTALQEADSEILGFSWIFTHRWSFPTPSIDKKTKFPHFLTRRRFPDIELTGMVFLSVPSSMT